MASSQLITTFLLLSALALSRIDSSSCQVVKAKVSCVDCPSQNNVDLSGIKVSVKCEKVKKVEVAFTRHDGSFEAKLPLGSDPHNSGRCLARILGGPKQLYASRKDMVSQIVKDKKEGNTNTYTISTPLSFFTTKPKARNNNIGSSKTVDLPLPPEWGLAPSSYYVPFFPIIGIP
ncbi:Pollen Ole e 1 allergen and extensin family protein [Senna tora]|uniref:Pollen Ole e 1 allergen and extensin family protein n=1 Tax=Senna tora TaxID=362788 RepID=A0A834TSP8_9FABA|nr:Pollen Ole e 1 allergen and extensin family protein [Senna tora]